MTGDVRAQLAALCDDTIERLGSGPARDAVAALHRRLEDPLRVAVAGPVSAGKSTLVNALLGRVVAPVGAGDSTRVVTWYRFDHRERVDVRLRDGGSRTTTFDRRGRLPADLGVAPDAVDRVDVYLSNDRLRSVVIIDTPGLDTVRFDAEQRTASALGLADGEGHRVSVGAVRVADAVLYLFPTARQHDADVLAQFDAEGGRGSGVSVVGVLSKVDRLVEPGDDPWPVAARLAAAAAERLPAGVLEVVPVVGLLAEAARGGELTERDAAHVAALSKLDPVQLDDLLFSPGDFLNRDIDGVSVDDRRRLLSLMDLYGIRTAVTAQRESGAGLLALLAALDESSGVGALEEVLQDRFLHRAELLKVHAVLTDLDRLSYRSAGSDAAAVLRSLRNPLERLELDPTLHDLRVLDFARLVSDGELAVAPDLVEDLRRLGSADDAVRAGVDATAPPPAIAAAAAQCASRWSVLANDPVAHPDLRRGAWEVRRAFELVWDRQQSESVS